MKQKRLHSLLKEKKCARAYRLNPRFYCFCMCFGSEFEKTTATHTIQRASTGSTSNNTVPVVVVVCGDVEEEQYEEV